MIRARVGVARSTRSVMGGEGGRPNGGRARGAVRTAILDVPVDAVTSDEALGSIHNWLAEEVTRKIAYVNPEVVMRARRDSAYCAYLNDCDLLLPDGIGVVLASKLLGSGIAQRVAGSDFIWAVAGAACRDNAGMYLLGGRPGVADRAAEALRSGLPGLRVLGTRHGFFQPEEEESLLEEISACGAKVVIVCLGMGKQESWIARHERRLPGRVLFGNGGALDFVSGVTRRAPRWVQALHSEWLFRLLLEPRRLGRQVALGRFVLAVLARLPRTLLRSFG